MTKKKPPMVTAAELMAKLNADPHFVAARARQDALLAEKEAEHRQAEAPLVDELCRAGLDIESVWDLVNTPVDCPVATPVLLKHLVKGYPDTVREGIARALAVPSARVGWTTLMALYEAEESRRVKSGLAAAIAAAANEELLDDVIRLVRDPRHGSSRLILLAALQRYRAPSVDAVFMELREDPDLRKELRIILARTSA